MAERKIHKPISVGDKFFRLTVQKSSKPKKTQCGSLIKIWECKCDCGNIVFVKEGLLKSERTKSCGCYKKDLNIKRAKNKVFGTPEYGIWASMIQRCTNPKRASFKDYGGRGIEVCDEWKLSFTNFLNDMGNRPSSSHTIDRIENDKGYNAKNCRWATRTEQSCNTSRNIRINYNGKNLTIGEWSKETGIIYNTLLSRVKAGWPPEKALAIK